MPDLTPYQERGFASRTEYLRDLAENYGIDEKTVYALANLLGEDEDFDGLPSALDDLADGSHLDYLDYLDYQD